MNNKMKSLFPALLLLIVFTSCRKKDETTPGDTDTATTAAPGICPTCNFPDSVWINNTAGPKLIFKFICDSIQARLGNTGAPSTIAEGYAAQSPRINGLSANAIELAQTDQTALGQGLQLYKGQETVCGGANAITFCKSVVCKNGDVFFSVPLSQVVAGTYKWLRLSLAYQNFDIKVKNTSAGIIDGTIAAFTGYNTYVSKYRMKGAVMTPTAYGVGNKQQGYWGFYASVFNTAVKIDGQAQQTTVVNPNAASPVPAGSSVITGEFYNTGASAAQPLVITGSETQDIIITVSLSTNKSFEWKEFTADGLFQPEIGEFVVDMGARGLMAKF